MFLRVTAVIAAVTLTMALFSGCGKKAVNDYVFNSKALPLTERIAYV